MTRISRREFLIASGITVASFPWQQIRAEVAGVLVNDVHSQLNSTSVKRILNPTTESELIELVRYATKSRKPLAVCGARHSAGGQQFLQDHDLIDITGLKGINNFDAEAGLITVQPGLRWDELQNYLQQKQNSNNNLWAVNQKQTGLNTLTISGTAGANAHGHGLKLKPFVESIESFKLITGNGDHVKCGRSDNRDLFSLATGGYGLFGIMSEITLKLTPRTKTKRVLKPILISDLESEYNSAVKRGCRYGHCQINVDDTSEQFLSNGFFSSYEPVSDDTPLSQKPNPTRDEWIALVELAHTHRALAYKKYIETLLSSDGSVDWSDEWQNNLYVPDYHAHMHSKELASEVLSEFFLPISKLENFLLQAKKYFEDNQVNIIFSVIRFIEKDDETSLPWAKNRYVCVIFNFHTLHTRFEIAKTMTAFSFLIDKAIEASGTFYLTYQHVANKQQLLACYPEFNHFLAAKLKHDPSEVFQSDWYRWQRNLLS